MPIRRRERSLTSFASVARLVAVVIAAAVLQEVAAAVPASATPAPEHPASWVVEQFYARPSFPEKRDYITGEFAENYAGEKTMGERLPPGVVVTSRAVREDDSSAVFATALRDGVHAQDWYTFLRLEGGRWKIAAVRTLVVPRFHYILLDTLRASRAAGLLPDSAVPQMERMALTVASDSTLAAYLDAHRAELFALAQRFAALPRLEAASVDGAPVPPGSVTPAEERPLVDALRALRISEVRREHRYPGCVFLEVGGYVDNEVGFMYAPPGCAPPVVESESFIYLGAAGPGWYVYKTT